MPGRYVFAITLGAVVTFGLLFLMQLMIDTGHAALTARRTVPDIAFVRVHRTPPPLVVESAPEKPPEAPPKPDTSTTHFDDDFAGSIPVSFPEPGAMDRVRPDGPGFGAADGDYLPIVIVEPVYPTRAITRELEGYVLLEFTVTPAGTTRDIAVVESSSTIFERAAIESALRYKYRPRVVNGRAIEVSGVRARIRFELED